MTTVVCVDEVGLIVVAEVGVEDGDKVVPKVH